MAFDLIGDWVALLISEFIRFLSRWINAKSAACLEFRALQPLSDKDAGLVTKLGWSGRVERATRFDSCQNQNELDEPRAISGVQNTWTPLVRNKSGRMMTDLGCLGICLTT